MDGAILPLQLAVDHQMAWPWICDQTSCSTAALPSGVSRFRRRATGAEISLSTARAHRSGDGRYRPKADIIYAIGSRRLLAAGGPTWLASEASPYLKVATRLYFQHCRNMD
jgi:hypothetical protein